MNTSTSKGSPLEQRTQRGGEKGRRQSLARIAVQFLHTWPQMCSSVSESSAPIARGSMLTVCERAQKSREGGACTDEVELYTGSTMSRVLCARPNS